MTMIVFRDVFVETILGEIIYVDTNYIADIITRDREPMKYYKCLNKQFSL